MGDGQLWILLGRLLSLADFSAYSTKDWLQLLAAVLAMAGYVYGLWKAFRFSKRQIVKRILEYLEDEEITIKEVRNVVVRHIRYGDKLPKRPNHIFHQYLKGALSNLERGEAASAERQLADFATFLAEDASVGRKYTHNANLQSGTVCLVLGRIANGRSESGAARTAWENALRYNAEDAEAARYLGELDIAAGEIDEALEHFSQAYALAPADKLLKAETLELVASYYQRRGSPKLELKALNECTLLFEAVELHDKAAVGYARAGEIAAELGYTQQAPRLLKLAFDNYRAVGDGDGMMAVRARLELLGEDVSNLPTIGKSPGPRIPWFWLRLALEVVIAAGAASLFYFSLR